LLRTRGVDGVVALRAMRQQTKQARGKPRGDSHYIGNYIADQMAM
jgi:hypothetical protein